MKSITVITPSFNQGHFLEQTIDSVLSQNYPALEYIIMDGGSTDQSVEIIKKYEKHLAYWVSEPDKGQSDAINKGLQKATGDIFNWINSDDYYEPDALHKVAAAFEDNQVNVVCGRGNIIKTDGIFVRYSRGTDVYEGNLAKTIGWARIDQPETFFRRSILENTGKLGTEFHYVMDKALWINYLLYFGLNSICKIDDLLINFRLHESSKTVSQSEGFDKETMSLYFSLAQKSKLNKEAELIHDLSGHADTTWLPTTSHMTSKLMKIALHYYLLRRADEYYYTHQRSKSKKCLSGIDKSLLEPEDQALFRKLRLRNTILASKIRKLLRK